MSARKLPPYGRELRAWLAADPKPKRWGCNGAAASITITIGSGAWSWARDWHDQRLVLVVPPGESAANFDWRDCAGHDPILVAECGDVQDGELDRLVRALMRDGVERVLMLATMDRYSAEGMKDAA